ncbi:hypothetical protein [Fimbriimonas ginsengisoli]|nr:hypothetical protein [Fimbriimonas ginsengisoli]
MDIARFDLELKSALGDVDGALYDATARTAAMWRAVREYSRYHPVQRQYGTGAVALEAAPGSNTISLVGGPVRPGDVIQLDPFFSPETVTVQSIALPAGTDGSASTVTATLTAPTAVKHLAGVSFARSTTGLAIAIGTGAYALPLDFQQPNQESFDLAVGDRAQVSRTNAYYDAVYGVTMAQSGVGFGYRQGFGTGYLNYGRNPNGGGQSSSSQTIYRFVPGVPPVLTVTPTPAAARTLDFYYLGQHVPATVPDSEIDALLVFASYAAMTARAASSSAMLPFKQAGVEEEWDKVAKALNETAAMALQDWERRIAGRPYATSG